MNLTYFRIDLTRHLRDVSNIAFVIGLPVLMYLIFGSAFTSPDVMSGNANTQFYVMMSMAIYGASVATTAIAGMASVELMQGWGRQVALTPMRPAQYVATKITVALTVAAGGVLAVFLAGILTGARATSAGVWVTSGLLAWLLSGIFALFGLAVAQTFKSESAISIASAGLVVLAFFGNLMMPLSGTIMQLSRFTPMYGYAAIARWPQLAGVVVATDGPPTESDPLWLLLVNYVTWLVIFAAIALLAVRRGRRQ